MNAFLTFLWIAFRNYWGVWVTGTGAVGLFLFLLSLAQNLKTWKVKPRHYAVVLFSVFWFLATFCAWHDAEKNLHAVIEQRSKDNSELSSCNANLKVEATTSSSWRDRFADQQRVINGLQAPGLKQQAIINDCVVALGKMNPMVNSKVTALALQYGQNPVTDQGGRKLYVFALVVITNHRQIPKGLLRCSHDFELATQPQLARQSGMDITFNTNPRSVRLNDREYSISISDLTTDWDMEHPIYATAVSIENDLGGCTFSPQS